MGEFKEEYTFEKIIKVCREYEKTVKKKSENNSDSKGHQKHHIIPNIYLQQWENEHNEIFISNCENQKPEKLKISRKNKDTGKKERTEIENSYLIQNNFYSFPTSEDEYKLDLEHFLSCLESFYGDSIRSLNSQKKLSEPEKIKLSFFIISMLLRTKKCLAKEKSTTVKYIDLMLNGTKERDMMDLYEKVREHEIYEELENKNFRTDDEELKDFLSKSVGFFELYEKGLCYSDCLYNTSLYELFKFKMVFLAYIILNKNWKILETNEPEILTGTFALINPCKHNTGSLDYTHISSNLELMDAQVITFALSPKKLLVISNNILNEEQATIIKQHNRGVIQNIAEENYDAIVITNSSYIKDNIDNEYLNLPIKQSNEDLKNIYEKAYEKYLHKRCFEILEKGTRISYKDEISITWSKFRRM